MKRLTLRTTLLFASNAVGQAYFQKATIGEPGGKKSEETVKPLRPAPAPKDSQSLARFPVWKPEGF